MMSISMILFPTSSSHFFIMRRGHGRTDGPGISVEALGQPGGEGARKKRGAGPGWENHRKTIGKPWETMGKP